MDKIKKTTNSVVVDPSDCTAICKECGHQITNIENSLYSGMCSFCWYENVVQPVSPEWIKVAKSLCVDLDNDVEVEARKLKRWGKRHNFTADEVEELCDIDSVYMFRVINEI